ncbi:MAG: organic solvent ABC transporter permease, partial [Marinobacter sp.]|nr:organic solvent ABC transporter permease [Marinobacter sp.]
MTLLSVVALTGCLDSGGSSSDDRSTGQITPTGIQGLHYQTNSQDGTTGASGQFRYYPGERLTLRVGNLALYSGIPAQDYVTPLEFAASIRDQLELATVDELGLLSHKPTEKQLIESDEVMNVTRLLMSLSWQATTTEGRGIDIRERVISQLNAALPTLDGEIDFSVASNTFAATDPAPSPANQLLAKICFHPEGDELCEDPPTQAEIDNAPEAPQNQQDRDPDVEYRQ